MSAAAGRVRRLMALLGSPTLSRPMLSRPMLCRPILCRPILCRPIVAGSLLGVALIAMLGCSSPTDVVGVVNEVEGSGVDAIDAVDGAGAPPTAAADDTSAEDAAADDASGAADVALLLAGRPVSDWEGDALEWPLPMPLAELFAEEPGDGERDGRASMDPWASRRVEQRFSRGGSRRSDAESRSTASEERLLILEEDDARELLELLASARGPGSEDAALFRDERGDVYQVSLEGDESIDAAGCFGRMRREPFECADREAFD